MTKKLFFLRTGPKEKYSYFIEFSPDGDKYYKKRKKLPYEEYVQVQKSEIKNLVKWYIDFVNLVTTLYVSKPERTLKTTSEFEMLYTVISIQNLQRVKKYAKEFLKFKDQTFEIPDVLLKKYKEFRR